MRKTLVIGFLMILCLATHAQTSKEFIFAFAPRDTVFCIDYGNNRSELDRLKAEIAACYKQIYGDTIAVFVSGYCAQDYRRAVFRNRKLKAVLINEANMREEFFVTKSRRLSPDNKTNYIRVEMRTPQPHERLAVNIAIRRKFGEPVYEDRPLVAETPPVTTPTPIEEETVEAPTPVKEESVETPTPVKEEPVETQIPVKEEVPMVEQPSAPIVVAVKKSEPSGKFAIRTNLLYWLATLPNLGIEYKPSDSFGILVNGGWNHFIWKDEYWHDRSYFVQPEIRFYLGETHRWFLGMEGHIAQFNLKFNKTGRQGDIVGGGLTGGYRMRLSRVFDMDFSLGLGYTHIEYEKYARKNGELVLKTNGLKKDFFGPTQVGVSLIWKIR